MKVFGGNYVFDLQSAPQGQNQYSSNFTIKNKKGERFLLKVILLEKVPSRLRGQTNAEIDIYKNVVSPYVIHIIEYKETSQYIFLIFPYLTGKNLGEYIVEHGRVIEAKAKEIGIGILRGIADIHRSSNGRIVHQDLKPQNVLITQTNEVVLLDFGAARWKQSSFRGAARHNFAYCSREQIRASRPYSAEDLRLTITDKSDVFAAGLILYYLLEGKHPHANLPGQLPADAILDARPIPLLSGGTISNDLKKIISKMLEYEPLNRLNAQEALLALESGSMQIKPLEKSTLFYCATSSVKAFIRFKKKDSKLFDGLVIEATQLPSRRRDAADLHNKIKTVIIDPQTYIFQKPDVIGKTAKQKFLSYPYYREPSFWLNPQQLITKIRAKDSSIINFIKNVFSFQIDNGADVLLAPYFYISEFTDYYWTVDQEITELAVEVYNELEQTKPLIKALAISEEILQSDTARNRITEYLQSLYDYKGFFVLLESSHKETIISEPWLKSASTLFTHLLATQKFVIWSRAELFGLALAASGLNITVGELQKQRKFNIVEEAASFGKKGFFLYIPNMFARAKWPDAIRALNLYSKKSELFCQASCCVGVHFDQPTSRKRDALALHYITTIRNQFDSYVGRGGIKKLADNINNAIKHFNNIKLSNNKIVSGTLRRDIKPDSSNFLVCWKNTLGI